MQEPFTKRVLYTAGLLAALGLAAFLLPCCEDDAGGEGKNGQPPSPVARGKKIYSTVCVACHHPDPTQEYGTAGTFGPPIADSSFELLKMRILSTSYPKGYKPKRDTNLMTTFPNLTDDQIRALHAFLQDAQKAKDKKKGE